MLRLSNGFKLEVEAMKKETMKNTIPFQIRKKRVKLKLMKNMKHLIKMKLQSQKIIHQMIMMMMMMGLHFQGQWTSLIFWPKMQFINFTFEWIIDYLILVNKKHFIHNFLFIFNHYDFFIENFAYSVEKYCS